MKIKWLWGDNYVNIQDRIMIIVHCPSSHRHLSINQSFILIPTVVLKLFAGQVIGRTDKVGTICLPLLGSIKNHEQQALPI